MLFRCPQTGSDLIWISPEELRVLNRNISNKRIKTRTGELITKAIEQALISADKKHIYPVNDKIFFFLENKSIHLDELLKDKSTEGQQVKEFYDNVGWQKDPRTGNYLDAEKFEDLRPIMSDYIHKCHLRINKYVGSGGKFLIDAASGPVQFDEYLDYSDNFEYRVCVDFSLTSLKEAKKKLSDKGIYVLADIANLPFKNDVAASVISLNTIYHIDKKKQFSAIEELYRVLKPEKKLVLVLDWGRNSLLMNIFLFPFLIYRRVIKWVKSGRNKTVINFNTELYFYAFSYKHYKNSRLFSQAELRTWRGISPEFSKLYIHKLLFGKQILSGIYNLEEKYPHIMGRYGKYPMFVITKMV